MIQALYQSIELLEKYIEVLNIKLTSAETGLLGLEKCPEKSSDEREDDTLVAEAV